jgi:tetratricopeptide (TPR) repeat protein
MSLAAAVMSTSERIRRRKWLGQAEGYLDLIMMFDDRWPLGCSQRELLAACAIQQLDCIAREMKVHSHDWYLRGQAHRLCGRFDSAIECLNQSLALHCDNVPCYLALGWCYKRTGQLELAIESLESALEREGESAIIHYNLACYWSLAHQPTLSVFHLTAALDLNPDFRDLIAAEADFDPIRQHPEFVAATSVTA